MLGANAPLAWGFAGLIAAYAAIALLLVVVGLWARIPAWIRVAGAAVTVVFFLSSYHTFADAVGWPTEARLPDRFELIAGVVEEPDKRSRSTGSIFLWVVALPGEGPVSELDLYDPTKFTTRLDPRRMPRAYRVPYDRLLHERVHDARIRLDEKVRQVGVLVPPEEAGEEEGPTWAFYDRPEPVLAPQEFQ